ncbi:Uncharacterized protein Rs2_18943 [Raphanus sativus]|nr:Uncharacterized protein Rs2_18943 [Raphanus sativus]
MQRSSRVGSTSAQPDEVEDGMVDGSFHTPEWHAASRLPILSPGKSIRTSKRAQLDSERALKLSKGRNHSSEKSRRDKKDRDSKKTRNKKRKSLYLVAMKTNLEDQDHVLKDQRKRRSTSPADTNTLAKVKKKPMALYHSLDSLAI